MQKQYTTGVTLLELMVVIAVVAILSTIAVTTYRGYLMRTNRTEARTALLRIQTAQEKFFLQNNRYAKDTEMPKAPPDGLGVPAVSTPGGFYKISIADYTATTYTAVAQAQAGQLDDRAQCQTFKIDQNGGRTPAASTGCWK